MEQFNSSAQFASNGSDTANPLLKDPNPKVLYLILGVCVCRGGEGAKRVCVRVHGLNKRAFLSQCRRVKWHVGKKMTHHHPDCLCLRGEQPPTEASSTLPRDD